MPPNIDNLRTAAGWCKRWPPTSEHCLPSGPAAGLDQKFEVFGGPFYPENVDGCGAPQKQNKAAVSKLTPRLQNNISTLI